MSAMRRKYLLTAAALGFALAMSGPANSGIFQKKTRVPLFPQEVMPAHKYNIQILSHKTAAPSSYMSRFDPHVMDDKGQVLVLYIRSNEKIRPEGSRSIGAAVFDCVKKDRAYHTIELESVDADNNIYAAYIRTKLSQHLLFGDDGQLTGRWSFDLINRDSFIPLTHPRH